MANVRHRPGWGGCWGRGAGCDAWASRCAAWRGEPATDRLRSIARSSSNSSRCFFPAVGSRWRFIRDRLLSPAKEAPSSRELGYPRRPVSAVGWGPGVVARGLEVPRSSQLTPERCIIRELQKLELARALCLHAIRQRDCGACTAVVWGQSFPRVQETRGRLGAIFIDSSFSSDLGISISSVPRGNRLHDCFFQGFVSPVLRDETWPCSVLLKLGLVVPQ